MRRLIHEIHRRYLWQATGIYLGISWGALQVADAVTKSAGLPDWVPGLALVLLVIGFPVVVATAFVQEGLPGRRGARSVEAGGGGTAGADAGGAAGVEGATQAEPPTSPPSLAAGTGVLDRPSTRPAIHKRLLTWRNALLGGVAGFALLGLAVAGYFVMRVTGIGPVASLAAKGVIDEGEAIIIADFENTSSDPSLGDVVTEALRLDLAGSPALKPLAPSRIQEALRLMQRSPDERLSPALAREVAIREGIRAVLDGEVASAGGGYLLLAALRAPEGQELLATFRRTARSTDEVIDAIDRLSQDIREKAGESLKSIRAAPPLARVTTASLEALRKYVEAERAQSAGDERRALVLAREAVALDSTFAMAYRRIAAIERARSGGFPPTAAVEAATRAYELRDRLTELERYHTEATYHTMVSGDVDARIQAYEGILAIEPDDPVALNDLANLMRTRTRYEEAAELQRQAVSGPGRTAWALSNLAYSLALLPDLDGARAVLGEARREYPGLAAVHAYIAGFVALVAGDFAEAHAEGERLAVMPDASPAFRLRGPAMTARADAARGRLAEARRHLSELHARAREVSYDDVLGAYIWEAVIELRLRVPEATRAAIQAGLQALDSVPAEARETYLAPLAHGAIRAGEIALARHVLERWQAEQPASRNTDFREAQRMLGIMDTAESDPARAAAELEAFRTERRCPRCYTFELAALRARAGQMEKAAAIWEEVIAMPGAPWEVGLMTALAHERLGEAYEALGEPAKAAQHYARFAELWKDADPELQPRVRYARERAAALMAERG